MQFQKTGNGCARITIFIDDLSGGGVQRSMITLARQLLGRGHQVDLVVCHPVGDFLPHLPAGIRLIALEAAPEWRMRLAALCADPLGLPRLLRPVLLCRKPPEALCRLHALVRYLRGNRSDALLSATPLLNLAALWATRLAGVPTRVVVSERTSLAETLVRHARRRHLVPLLGRAYGQAAVVVAVSQALADELAAVIRFPRDRITTVYNPVVGPEIDTLMAEPVAHPWLACGRPPVILAVGRLAEQKDYPTLVRAFARLRRTREARLVILGGGARERSGAYQRALLHELAASLRVSEDLELPGFMPNPFAWMAHSSLLVLSSKFEGLPGVLIQALACGCPVVSTDCPTGPREILEDGRLGPLVPVGDDAALAEAIAKVLDRPPPSSLLRARAQDFSVELATDRYEQLLLGPLPRDHLGQGATPH